MSADLANPAAGGSILSATSFDMMHAPDSIIDGDPSSFWSTTGSYPQEFVLKLGTESDVESISTYTANVRKMTVETCTGVSPQGWEQLYEVDVEDEHGSLQVSTQNIPSAATFVKFKIKSGWADYATVHKVSVQGKSR